MRSYQVYFHIAILVGMSITIMPVGALGDDNRYSVYQGDGIFEEVVIKSLVASSYGFNVLFDTFHADRNTTKRFQIVNLPTYMRQRKENKILFEIRIGNLRDWSRIKSRNVIDFSVPSAHVIAYCLKDNISGKVLKQGEKRVVELEESRIQKRRRVALYLHLFEIEKFRIPFPNDMTFEIQYKINGKRLGELVSVSAIYEAPTPTGPYYSK